MRVQKPARACVCTASVRVARVLPTRVPTEGREAHAHDHYRAGFCHTMPRDTTKNRRGSAQNCIMHGDG
eukprot:2081048-Lingulodinium_polyedra.AAC.1